MDSSGKSASNDTSATVLVVEDEAIVALVLSRTLERQGFKVVTCANPTKALEIMQGQQIDLIIADVYIGKSVGKNFEALLKECISRKIEIMLTTGARWDNPPFELGREVRIFEKPYDFDKVVDAVSESIKTREESKTKPNRIRVLFIEDDPATVEALSYCGSSPTLG